MLFVALALDAWVAVAIAIGAWGGIAWHGKTILSHGADLRRAAILAALVCAYAWRKSPGLWRSSYALRAASLVWRWLETARGRRIALLIAFVVASVVGCLQALALQVPMYDVGIFHQLVWALAHGHGFLSTISGAGDFLLDHFSPTLVLLVPVYWVSGGSPLLLQIVHPALVFGGVAAWVWLAERGAAQVDVDGRARSAAGVVQPLGAGVGAREGVGSSTLAAATTLFALTFESLWGNLYWGFHENALAFAALSWALALAVARPDRRWVSLALFLVAALSKEILLVDVALALLAWAGIERRRARDESQDELGAGVGAARSAGFLIACVGLAAALLAGFVVFERMPHPADKNYFDRYYSYLGRGLGDFAATLLLSPWKVVQSVGAGELARYFWTVFAPWLFLPLIAFRFARRESAWLLAIAPSLASAALATFPPLRNKGFHYVMELWPVLAIVTIVLLSRLPARWALAWAILGLLAWDRDPWHDLREYARGAVAMAPVRQVMSEIPEDASVVAEDLSGTWLAGRPWITRWPVLDVPGVVRVSASSGLVGKMGGADRASVGGDIARDSRGAGACPQWLVLRGAEQVAAARARCGLVGERTVGDWDIARSR